MAKSVQQIYRVNLNIYQSASRETSLTPGTWQWDTGIMLDPNLSFSTFESKWDYNVKSINKEFWVNGIDSLDSFTIIGQADVFADNKSISTKKISSGVIRRFGAEWVVPGDDASFVTANNATKDIDNIWKVYLDKPIKDNENVYVTLYGTSNETAYFRVNYFTGVLDADGQEQVNIDNSGEVIDYNIANADTTKREFVVVKNRDFETELWLGIHDPAENPITITLTEPFVTSPRFEYSWLFKKQVTTTPSAPGEYRILPNTLEFFLGDSNNNIPSGEKIDCGHFYYHKNYPVEVLFASEPTKQIGTPGDVFSLEEIGVSDASASQLFSLKNRPVVFISGTEEPRIWVYDNDFSGAVEWTRVDDFSGSGPNDTHFVFYESIGAIIFGDGTNGKIPDVGMRIGASYKTSPIIFYNTKESIGYIIPSELNFNPMYKSGGDYYITVTPNEDALLSTLRLDIDIDNLLAAGIHGPLYSPSSVALFSVTALSHSGDAISDVEVILFSDYNIGNLDFTTNIIDGVGGSTNDNGVVQYLYSTPSNPFMLGEFVDNSLVNTTANTIEVNDIGLYYIDSYNDVWSFFVNNDDPLQPWSNEVATSGRFYAILDGYYNMQRPNGVNGNVIQYPAGSLAQYDDVKYNPSSRVGAYVIAPRVMTFQAKAYSPIFNKYIYSNKIKVLIAVEPGYANVFELGKLPGLNGITWFDPMFERSYLKSSTNVV